MDAHTRLASPSSRRRNGSRSAFSAGSWAVCAALGLAIGGINGVAAEQLAMKPFGVPMHFEANAGQADGTVQYLARGSGYTLYLTPTEAVLGLRAPLSRGESQAGVRGKANPKDSPNPRSRKWRQMELRMALVGGNSRARAIGENELEGTVNYFLGNDPAKWRAGIPTFAKVRYQEVYAGVDLVYYGSQKQLEFDFVVNPGANPNRIRLALSGIDRLEIDDEGGLVAQTGGSAVRWHKPVAYQDGPGGRTVIPVHFQMHGSHHVGFGLGDYDASRPLVIDPVLIYASFLGGGDDEYLSGATIDSSGNIYVVGDTLSLSFPTTNAYRATPVGSNDVFVTKFNAAGTALVFSTYLGGTGDDFGMGLTVDSSNTVYVVGQTDSVNFPTRNPYQAANAGYYDAFVTRLGSAGTNLLYSTYFGGPSDDGGNTIASDNAGNAYIGGDTYSIGTGNPRFPTRPNNAFQSNNGGGRDAFVAKFDSTLTGDPSLIYSTFLGGNSDEKAQGIRVDGAGNAYVVGEVGSYPAFPTPPSSDFPILNAFQSSFNRGNTDPLAGNTDGFLTKVNATGTGLLFSTFLGGGDEDTAAAIVVDASGRVFVCGETSSLNFPVTNAAQSAIAGGESGFPAPDLFIMQFQSNGTSLLYSTYLGGTDYESGFSFFRPAMAIDNFGNIHVAGQTTSLDYPVTVGADQTNAYGPSDAFVTKINPAVPGPASIVYSSLVGGEGDDRASGIAVDANGNFYVAGRTSSVTNFPTTVGSYDTVFNGGFYDAFVAKFSPPPDLSVAMFASTNPVPVGSNLTYSIRVNNNGRSTFNNVTNTVLFSTNLQIISVTSSLGSFTTNAGIVQFNIGTVTNNASITQTIVLNASIPVNTTNTATLTSTETPILEPNTGNNLAALPCVVRGIADVTINTLATPNPVFVTSNVTFTIGVTNKGPWPATSVMVTNFLPAGLSRLTNSTTQGICTFFAGVLTCNLGTLASGASAQITLVAMATNTATVTNNAVVSAFEVDNLPANNSAATIVTIDPLANLAISGSASTNVLFAGQDLTYNLTVTNSGPSTAAGVVLTDTLPPASVFVMASVSQGTFNHSNGIVTCSLGSMPTGAVATASITVRPITAGTATNTAGVTSATFDPNSGNNSLTLLATVNPAANLALSQTASPPATIQSSNVVFNLVVSNLGPSTATGVVLTDTLPAGLLYFGADPSQGSVTVSNNIVTFNFGTIASGASASADLEVMTLIDGIFTNAASVNSPVTDLITANNSATATVKVVNLEIFRTGTNVVLRWSTNEPAFILQSKADLTTNTAWVNVGIPPVVISNRFTVTNDTNPTNRFYRLRR